MRRWTALVPLVLFVCNGMVVAHAQSPSPTPGNAPKAPTGVGFANGLKSVIWVDNSNNETGFGIELEVNAAKATYSVPADTTSFVFPAGPVDAKCGSFRVAVSAFNDAGASEADSTTLILECQIITATPRSATPAASTTPRATLPATGTGQVHDSRGWVMGLAFVVAVAAALFAGLAIKRRRNRA